MIKRTYSNWLKGYMNYVKDTESPQAFWMWSGIFTLASALQRRVWLPFGLDNIYPNLYVLFVAPPAICRKGLPVSQAKKMLKEVGFKVSVDSTSKRALTKELAKAANEQIFTHKGIPHPQATMAVISKELSSLLAIDPKGMIEVLTDLYDSHDTWEYETSGQGQDFLEGVCVSCLLATTPSWFSDNLPYEAIGGGFSSRFVIVTAKGWEKDVPIPPIPDKAEYKNLIKDLSVIGSLKGEFDWPEESRTYYAKWYKTLKHKVQACPDERLHPFIGRMHVIALKVSMALHAAYSNRLVLTLPDVKAAIELLEEVLSTASQALGGVGLSKYGPITEKIKIQIAERGKITERELLQRNYRHIEPGDLTRVISTLKVMGVVKERIDSSGQITYIYSEQGD